MSTADYTRIQNDTGRPIKDTLQTDGSADDLSGATVVFTMWQKGEPPKIDENSSNVDVEPAGTGTVDYNFQAGDLDTVARFFYEWEVTFADGTIVTYRDSNGDPKEIKVKAEGA
jgi:hypothetical protein